jgi:hypothetical protein
MRSPGDPLAKPSSEILTVKSLFCPIDTKHNSSLGPLGQFDQCAEQQVGCRDHRKLGT